MNAERSAAGAVRDVEHQLRAAGLEDTPRLDAELLVGHVCGLDRVQLRTRGDEAITGEQEERLAALVARRAEHEPVQYILERAWFYGLEFEVTPAVLVPRPETEALVEGALAAVAKLVAAQSQSQTQTQAQTQAQTRQRPLRIVDACTGSGCVAISVADALRSESFASIPAFEVYATELSSEALLVATRNAVRHDAPVEFVEGDLLEPLLERLGTGSCDVVVANPPYVLEGDRASLPRTVADHEPHLALFVPHADAMALIERIAGQAARLLAPDSTLLVEHGEGQRGEVLDSLASAGFTDLLGLDDLAGIDRVVQGSLPVEWRVR